MVIASHHLADHVPDPRQSNPNVDLDLCNIIQRMMAKNRDDRYQTMQEVVTVLADYQNRRLHPPPESVRELPEIHVPELITERDELRANQAKDSRRFFPNTFLPLMLLALLVWVALKVALQLFTSSDSKEVSILNLPVLTTTPSTASPPTPPADSPSTTPLLLANFNADDPLARMRPAIDFSGNCNGGIVENAGFQQTGGWWIDYHLSRQSPTAQSWFRLKDINTRGYDALTFIAKSNGSDAVGFSVILQGTDSKEHSFVVDPVGSKWTLIRIPLENFNLPGGELREIKIRFDRNSTQPPNGSISLDEVMLSPPQPT